MRAFVSLEYSRCSYSAVLHLVCFQVALAGSLFMVGLLVGTGVAGKLSDTIGRRKTLFLLLCIGAICQLLCGFAYSYETYLVARFFSAFGEANQTQPYLGVTDFKSDVII